MSNTLPNMLENTISKIREMVDVNNVIGEPIVVGDITIIPVSKVSVGFGGGGSDYVKNVGSNEPFGGGVGGDAEACGDLSVNGDVGGKVDADRNVSVNGSVGKAEENKNFAFNPNDKATKE